MIRILLAEDDGGMRGFLAQALESAGYEVVAVEDGIAARAQLDSAPFDLLLSDVVMPGISGIELARYCEQTAPTTRVVLITGFAAVSIEADRLAPRVTVLSKPFHLRTLVHEVERLFC